MSKEHEKQTMTPRLRFPEFRDGDGWDTPSMSDLYGFKPTNTLSRDKLNYEGGSTFNIHYGDIHTKFRTQFRLTEECVPLVNADAEDSAGSVNAACEEGDIILADASEDLNDVGKAIELVSLDGQRVVSGTHTIHATRLHDLPVIGFGGYLFQSGVVREGIQKEAQGAKVYGISANRIGPVTIPLPATEAEQREIAACLGSLDDWIVAEDRRLAALRRHKTGLMQQLFPRPGQTRPRLRFPEFQNAGEWEEKPLAKLCTAPISYGIVQAGPHVPDGMPYIKSTDLNGPLYLDDLSRTSAAIAEKYRRSEVVPGDLVFSLRGNIGVSQIVPGAIPVANLTQGTARIRTKASTTFVYNALSSEHVQEQIAAVSKGSTLREISLGDLRKLSLPHPEPAEQRRIADCLTSLDARLSAQSAKLAALRHHKRGLMQQLFP